MSHDRASWPDLVCLGEVLIDVLSIDTYRSLREGWLLRATPGGAPANVAVAAARLGVASAFIGKVGADPFGMALRDLLSDEGVDVRAVITEPAVRTPLALVTADAAFGQRFLFYRQGTADTLLDTRDVDLDLLENARAFHFGSVSLSAEPARSATLAAAKAARDFGALVSFDPNVRLDLWPTEQTAREAITDAVALAHIVKLSSDEIPLVCGTSDPLLAAERVAAAGPALVVVTLGADGCAFWSRDGTGALPSPSVAACDSTGAGDAFMAGLLVGVLRAPGALEALRGQKASVDAVPLLHFAATVGALTTTRPGAIPALPTLVQVESLLHESTDTSTGGASA